MPKRIVNLVRRLAGLKPGKYVITLTVKDAECIYSVSEMGKTEK